MTTYINNRFEWGVVLAGSVIAISISIVLMQFGSAIGLSAQSPLRADISLAAWEIIAVGIWMLWIQLLASFAGGYAAGYLRQPMTDHEPYENELHGGLYGLSVWAVSTITVFVFAAIAVAVTQYIDTQSPIYEVNDALTNTEQNTAIIFAFAIGATSLLSAVAAWWAATMGGEHRYNKIDFSSHLSFRK